ncbi:barren [Anaeromyces robustus]|uniref:Condensin complex subunit 2 n=1 Tax=Anaeromyces robustus TaxID=1754192 RepID=A0A1Y1XK03_9FUNG|nr:barren [Anaeromyces robustus]|eukprot:ORX86080.1 barren [Anaeromyces robustus]
MINDITPIRQPRNRQNNSQMTSLKRGSSPQRKNDDEIEKRRRRQSFKDDRRRRLSLLSPPKPMMANMTVQEPVPVTKLPSVEVMNKHFEEWMKIAADNKINASNSWDLALIDYFHDMKILKDGDSINFQKASCTLDGCVKIYSSRVDSVATETGKLLSGLTENSKSRNRMKNVDEDGNEIDDDNQTANKKRSMRKNTTLEKDINNLNVKKFDLEFSVDPLFKKTCADFDEGGAKGLLLNHLGINENGMIIFDASDAIEDEDIEDFDLDDDVIDEEKEKESYIDISILKDKFLTNADVITEYDICPQLKDFEFSSESVSKTILALQRINEENLKAAEDEIKNQEYDYEDDDIEEIFPTDLNPFMNDELDIIEDESNNNEIVENINYILDNSTKELENSKNDNNEEINNFDENCCELYKNNYENVEDDRDNIFSYFDSTMVKNWAGPAHWKLRPIRSNKTTTNQNSNENITSSTDHPSKKSNKSIAIDFINGDDISEEELFKPADRIPTLNNTNIKKSNFLLPEDSHFSSRDFLKLFLKPNVIIKFKKRQENEEDFIQENNDEFIDQAFWADHKDDAPIFEETHSNNLVKADNENVGILDNTTYFFNDDDDDDESFNEGENVDGMEENNNDNSLKDNIIDVDIGNYGEQLVAKPKKIKSLAINYARSAKRVDVKKLKDNIWKELSGTKNDENEKSKKEAITIQNNMEEESEENNKIQRDFKFSEIVGGLKDMYQEKNIKDISVAFCFICLLHLANEKDLEIISDGSLSELTITQNE